MPERALQLVLPWPSKELSPNGRVHWRVKAKATKAARELAVITAHEAGWRALKFPPGKLHLWIDCYQAPGKKLPDDDNMVGRCKAYRDGIAQAMGIDDGRFKCHPDVKNERRRGGQVVIRITGEPRP